MSRRSPSRWRSPPRARISRWAAPRRPTTCMTTAGSSASPTRSGGPRPATGATSGPTSPQATCRRAASRTCRRHRLGPRALGHRHDRLGPVEDCFSNGVDCGGPFAGFPGDPDRYGPYGLETVGRSVNTNDGAGRRTFQTSSGGRRSASSHPCARASTRCSSTTSFGPRRRRRAVQRHAGCRGAGSGAIVAPPDGSPVSVTLRAECPSTGWSRTRSAFRHHDDARDDAPGRSERPVDGLVLHDARHHPRGAARRVDRQHRPGSDIDLYVYGPDGALVGASFSPTDTESVSILFPEDGTYRIDVHGFASRGYRPVRPHDRCRPGDRRHR